LDEKIGSPLNPNRSLEAKHIVV